MTISAEHEPFLISNTPNNVRTKILVHQDPKENQGAAMNVWYRGATTRRAPKRWHLHERGGIGDWIVRGWEPAAPLIDRTTKVTAFGSCFAANISSWLGQRNYRVSTVDAAAQDAYVVRIGEGMVNSFVIRQQFEWAWENKTFDAPLWHGYRAEDFGYDPAVQKVTKDLFDQTDVFILTLGLSEIWYDEETDGVFWRTIPKAVYDPSRHKFRVSTVQENKGNLLAIYGLIRKHRPDAKIVLTLSPIPLKATFRDVSCVSANAVSKSVLRVAIDEVMRELGDEGVVHYWPSYEIVTEGFTEPFKADRNHIHSDVLKYIMMLFEHYYCVDEDDRLDLDENWARAMVAAKGLPPVVTWAMDKGRMHRLSEVIENRTLSDDPQSDRAMKATLSSLIERWSARHPPDSPPD